MYTKYMILFHLLDYCYEKSSDLDLPPFLGELCPYLWGGGMPMDREVYQKWQCDSLLLESNHEILYGVINLLTFYENKYHFDFKDTKKILLNMTDKELNKVIQEALK